MAIDYTEALFTKEKLKRVSKKAKKEEPKKVSLEEALETLKSLGFSIVIPTSEQEKERQESSLAKLGFSDTKPKRAKDNNSILKGYLHSTHRVGSATYGPGEIELPYTESELFRSLLQQDQLCIRSQMDTTQYSNSSRCFIVQPGRSQDTKHRYAKQEVSEHAFNSDAFLASPSITTGGLDIAGYNPVAPKEF